MGLLHLRIRLMLVGFGNKSPTRGTREISEFHSPSRDDSQRVQLQRPSAWTIDSASRLASLTLSLRKALGLFCPWKPATAQGNRIELPDFT